MARNLTKQIDARRINDATTLERNGLLIAMRQAQNRTIAEMRECGYDAQTMRRRGELYISRALMACSGLLGRGENPQIVMAALGRYTALASCAPAVTPGVPMAVRNRMQLAINGLLEEAEDYKRFYHAAQDRVNGVPFTPETAACAELAMNMNYFDQVRAAKRNRDLEKDAEMAFVTGRGRLFELFEADGVNKDDLMKVNHDIVVNLVLSQPEPYQYMFNYLWDEYRVDLSQAEKQFGPGRGGMAETMYQQPIGGLSFAVSGNRMLYRFGYRPVYSFNMYDDMIYEETKEHYGPILKSSRTGDKSYLQSAAYQASQRQVQAITRMMQIDNYTQKEISGVMRAAGNRCEMFYSTETEDGRAEWAQQHPEEAAELAAEKARREGGAAAKKEHIKIASARKETEVIEWLSCPTDDDYEPELMQQAAAKIIPGRSLKSTFNEQDFVQLASVMAEFAESINALEDVYNLEKWYVPLKSDPEACIDRFIRKYCRMRMDPWQRKRYDLVVLAKSTADPVVDKSGKIVAVRSLGNLVTIGDTGGMVRGRSYVGSGCWVDERSGITNTQVTGGVMVLMQSNLRDSQVHGGGILANTLMANSKVTGGMDPAQMRKQAGAGTSAVRPLEIVNQNIDCQAGMSPEEKAKALENLKRQAMLRASMYKDKTVDQYVQELNQRDQVDVLLERLTPEQLRAREEEERRKRNEASRLMNDKNVDYAHVDEIAGKMRQMGVPQQVIEQTYARGVEAAQVDSVDVGTIKGEVLERHKAITDAVQAARTTEQKQAAQDAAKKLETEEPDFPGSSKWL